MSRTDIPVGHLTGKKKRQARMPVLQMATDSDQARTVAERIARRVAAGGSPPKARSRNLAPPVEELAEIRSVLTELQKKLERVESKMAGDSREAVEDPPRARFRDFVNSSPPANATPSASGFSSGVAKQTNDRVSPDRFSEFTPPTHSPWLSGVYVPAAHPSQEKFGVEEATVSELVEFFENEKKCSVEPGGKPCDHCAMCSSRGF